MYLLMLQGGLALGSVLGGPGVAHWYAQRARLFGGAYCGERGYGAAIFTKRVGGFRSRTVGALGYAGAA
jgi:hypothetical protein